MRDSNEYAYSLCVDGRFSHVPVIFISPVISHICEIFITWAFTIRSYKNRCPRVCDSLSRVLNEVSVNMDLERRGRIAERCVNVREGKYIRCGAEDGAESYYM